MSKSQGQGHKNLASLEAKALPRRLHHCWSGGRELQRQAATWRTEIKTAATQ